MRLRSAMAAPATLLLAGCAALKGGDQPVTLRLEPTVPPATAPASAETVALAPVRARGFAGNIRLTYVAPDQPSVLHSARSLFWEEPPPQVLERALAATLRKHFVLVVASGRSPGAERRVSVILTRFEEISGPQAKAVVAFEAVMSKAGQTVRSGAWCGAVPIRGASPTDRARAFAAALTAAVTRFVQTPDGAYAAPGDC